MTMLSKYVYGLSLGHFVVDFSQGALAALLPLLIAQHHFNYAIAATLVFAMNLVSSITVSYTHLGGHGAVMLAVAKHLRAPGKVTGRCV